MTDETKQETETDDKETGTDQTKTEKTFTQEEVNKFLAREKAAWKRTHDKLLEEKDAEITSVREAVSKSEQVIGEHVKSLKADLKIPDEDWDFMAEGKDVFAQYEYLAKKVEKSGKREVPSTPSRSEEVSTQPFERINRV